MDIKNTIQPKALHHLLISDSPPILIDVRRKEIFQQSDDIIINAYWQDHQQVNAWAAQLPLDRDIIIYCAHGQQISLATSAILQSLGFNSRILVGGIGNWQSQNLPILDRNAWQLYYPKNWTTVQSVSLDGLACAWFIKRFINANASIFYIEDDWANDAAIETNTSVFNVNKTDTFACHNNAQCTFDSFINKFSIRSNALQYIALIIRSITTNRLDLSPEAAEVKAIYNGLTLTFTEHVLLQERSAHIFDALYNSAKNQQVTT